MVLKIIYKGEGKKIYSTFNKVLSRHSWKELELESKPGRVVSYWRANRDINEISREIRRELTNKCECDTA